MARKKRRFAVNDADMQATAITAQTGVVRGSRPLLRIWASDLQGRVRQSPYQARLKDFSPDDERDLHLADSIQQRGIIQPVGLRVTDDNSFEIVWGHRRVAAALWLLSERGVDTSIPYSKVDGNAQEIAILTATENFQREDLHAVERGKSVCLLREAGVPSAEIRQALGISRTTLHYLTKIGEAPQEIQEALLSVDIGVRYAAELVQMYEQTPQRALRIIERLAAGETQQSLKREEEKQTIVPQNADEQGRDTKRGEGAGGEGIAPSGVVEPDGEGFLSEERAAPVLAGDSELLPVEAWGDVLIEAGVSEEDIPLAICNLRRSGRLLPEAVLRTWALSWLRISPEDREKVRSAHRAIEQVPAAYKVYLDCQS